MSRSQKVLISAGLCLLVVIAILVLKRGAGPGIPGGSGTVPSAASRAPKVPHEAEPSVDSTKRPDRVKPRESSGQAGDFSKLEEILRDESRDDAATAVKLQDLAGRKDVSLEERIEALGHAVLLTPDSQGDGLVALARNHSLPPELASILLSDFHNRPDPVRLAGAVALAKNDDASTREEAMDLVRFLITGNESQGNDVEILEKAEAKLQNPAQRE